MFFSSGSKRSCCCCVKGKRSNWKNHTVLSTGEFQLQIFFSFFLFIFLILFGNNSYTASVQYWWKTTEIWVAFCLCVANLQIKYKFKPYLNFFTLTYVCSCYVSGSCFRCFVGAVLQWLSFSSFSLLQCCGTTGGSRPGRPALCPEQCP